MKQFINYVYTGKIWIELKHVIGLIKISSYYQNQVLIDQIKTILESEQFSALDLCPLYKDVRQKDIENFMSYLDSLIFKKSTQS